MKNILYPLILLISISLVSASLEDYPEPFVKDHHADHLAFVVSEEEVTLYSIVSADIASGLAPVTGNTKTLLDKELLTNYRDYDLILIGDPCENKLTSKFISVEYCDHKPGEARIKLVDNGDKKAIIVMGYNFDAIRNAGLVLRNYNDYALTGDEMTVTEIDDEITISNAVSKTITQAQTPKQIVSIPGCEGCLVDKTCLEEGERLFDEYCKDSSLLQQKESAENCNNNYECLTNKCKNNTCSKQTLLEMIINWLKSLF